MHKREIENIITEYIGSHFKFLSNYLDGSYHDYVIENIEKITTKKTFGTTTIRREYKNKCFLIEKVLDDCKKTIDYINNFNN